jgi:hypothetical protein
VSTSFASGESKENASASNGKKSKSSMSKRTHDTKEPAKKEKRAEKIKKEATSQSKVVPGLERSNMDKATRIPGIESSQHEIDKLTDEQIAFIVQEAVVFAEIASTRKSKKCHYFPFCRCTVEECRGTAVDKCMNVMNGTLAKPTTQLLAQLKLKVSNRFYYLKRTRRESSNSQTHPAIPPRKPVNKPQM